MSEFRQDRTTGLWVIVAPERAARPEPNQRSLDVAAVPSVAFDPSCPFCPGNEAMLPRVIDEVAAEVSPGWLARAVPNKYPAVSSEVPWEASSTGRVLAGFGHHEVIIETPRHNAGLTELSEAEITAVVQMYRNRYRALAACSGIASVLLFRNHGAGGGASLAHPHAQVIATPLVPPRIAAARAWAKAEYERSGHCAACAEIAAELENGRRVVEVTEEFVLAVPFAAGRPFELVIWPRRHRSSFGNISDAETTGFGRMLQRALRRLAAACDDPPYNFAIESGTIQPGDLPYAHWALRIVPDTVRPGGFELAGEMPINPSKPEDDAEILRQPSI